jgi:hypothetical protein
MGWIDSRFCEVRRGSGTLSTTGYVLYTGPIPVIGNGSASLSVYATEAGY